MLKIFLLKDLKMGNMGRGKVKKKKWVVCEGIMDQSSPIIECIQEGEQTGRVLWSKLGMVMDHPTLANGCAHGHISPTQATDMDWHGCR